MARDYGPIYGWHRGDTIPTEAEGGYAGAASTAAAVGASLAQSGGALQTATNLLRDSSVPGLLDYTLAGEAPGAVPPVTILSDNFNRTAAELVGTSPQIGPAWTGSASRWSANGARASASAGGPLMSDVGRAAVTVTCQLRVVTTATGSNQLYRCYLGATTHTPTAGVWVGPTITPTGNLVASLWKTVGGTSTNLGPVPVAAAANSATPQTVTLTLTLDGPMVTADLGEGVVTDILTSGEVAALSTRVGVFAGSSDTSGFAVDSITATRPGDPAAGGAGRLVTVTDGELPPAVLDSLDARYNAGGSGASVNAFDAMSTFRGFQSGDMTVAVVSDSTANDTFDWLRIWAQRWGATLGSGVRRVYNSWDRDANEWRAPVVDNEGGSGATPDPLDDTFTRTGALAGSSADTGQVWSHGTSWSTDGATASASATFQGAQTTRPAGAPVKFTIVCDGTQPESVAALRLYAGTSNNGLWANVTKRNTNDTVALSFHKVVGGSSTVLGSNVDVAGFVNAPNQVIELTITQNIQNVSLTAVCNGQTTTHTATISEAESSAIEPNVEMIANSGAPGYWKVDRVQATPTSLPATASLEVWNGAIAGGDLGDFDAAKRAQMFGSITPDVLILATGHNNGTQTGPAFTSQVEAWLSGWSAEHPDCLTLVTSQNPQFPPAANPAPHAARQAALRLWCKSKGIAYVPVFEGFAALPDGGASRVDSGGIHPTTGAGSDSGASLWADIVIAALDGP